MSKTSIEWTRGDDGTAGYTWNPVTGCTEISPGCDHCYAKTFAERWRGIPGHVYEQGFDLKLWPERITLPLHWKKPRRIFVNSMSDLFHKRVPFEFIEQVFDTMWRASHHTFQVLTKRPDRLVDFYIWHARKHGYSDADIAARRGLGTIVAPPNVWIGTSVENQKYADQRIPELLKVPARVRFLSCEPLLGPVDLSPWVVPTARWELDGYFCDHGDCTRPATAVRMDGYRVGSGWLPVCEQHKGIHWLIVGGESGYGARPMHPAWARSLRDQAQAAGTAYFFKQHGEYIHESQLWHDPLAPDSPAICTDAWAALVLGKQEPADRGWQHEDGSISYRVGKKAAGRLLDGREWNEFPDTAQNTPCASQEAPGRTEGSRVED